MSFRPNETRKPNRRDINRILTIGLNRAMANACIGVPGELAAEVFATVVDVVQAPNGVYLDAFTIAFGAKNVSGLSKEISAYTARRDELIRASLGCCYDGRVGLFRPSDHQQRNWRFKLQALGARQGVLFPFRRGSRSKRCAYVTAQINSFHRGSCDDRRRRQCGRLHNRLPPGLGETSRYCLLQRTAGQMGKLVYVASNTG